MLFILTIQSFLLVNYINGAFVTTWDEKNAKQDSFVDSSVVNNTTVSENTVGLYVDKYSHDDIQVTEIKDLPNLKSVWMYAIGQEVTVVFNNVPKLVDVDLSKNELVYISAQMFRNTQVEKIWMYNNKIRTIENNAFGPNVVLVSLYCNQLRSIKNEWFQDPSKISWLELHGNKIQHIKENQFKPFVNLKHINLVFNDIKRIGDGAFASGNIFSEIYLAYNKLTELSTNIFSRGRVRIENFDIRYNQLTYLSQQFMNKTSVSSIHLIDGNPWSCACYLKYITKWVNWDAYGKGDYHPKDREGEPRCVSSSGEDKNLCVEAVSQELIGIYADNSSPAPNTNEKYCACRMSGKSWIDCYRI